MLCTKIALSPTAWTGRSGCLLSTAASISRFQGFPNVKETGFEAQWRKLTEAERDVVEKEYQELGKSDWKKLTFEQMRARKQSLVLVSNEVYIFGGAVFFSLYDSV